MAERPTRKRERPSERFERLAERYPTRVERREYGRPNYCDRTPQESPKAHPVTVICPYCQKRIRLGHNTLTNTGTTCENCGSVLYDGYAYMFWPPDRMLRQRVVVLDKRGGVGHA